MRTVGVSGSKGLINTALLCLFHIGLVMNLATEQQETPTQMPARGC